MIERGSCVPSSMPSRCRQRTGRDVAHHDFERNDLDLADQLLAHVEPPDEMRRHADVVQVLEHVFGDAVVEDALAFDHLVLLRIEGGRIVLEMLDQSSGLGSLVKDLRLAFIDAATAAHRSVPWLVEIHWICRGSSFAFEVRGGGNGRHDSTQQPLRDVKASRWRRGAQST